MQEDWNMKAEAARNGYATGGQLGGALGIQGLHTGNAQKEQSEIAGELSLLGAALNRLGQKREQLSMRLAAISRAPTPQAVAQTGQSPQPSRGSPHGRELAELRLQIDRIAAGVEDDMERLAL